MDDITEFEAVEEDRLEMTVSDGTTYEFPVSHAPELKAMFGDLEIDGAEVPDIEWSGENFRERAADE
ncbi:hypothetical protein [Natrinema versiforme]|uniref:Uncharacterized protein n=1 Tax=Natrinema versiforme JCM 10478 TaxID=1227496 RepID=L9Y4A2_9EURY|nr:hypothetical protein [Natrinema versiforme]ELY68914.1 hypothetical protein C489_06093 [Natrinema versiforme JCM 10478]